MPDEWWRWGCIVIPARVPPVTRAAAMPSRRRSSCLEWSQQPWALGLAGGRGAEPSAWARAVRLDEQRRHRRARLRGGKRQRRQATVDAKAEVGRGSRLSRPPIALHRHHPSAMRLVEREPRRGGLPVERRQRGRQQQRERRRRLQASRRVRRRQVASQLASHLPPRGAEERGMLDERGGRGEGGGVAFEGQGGGGSAAGMACGEGCAPRERPTA